MGSLQLEGEEIRCARRKLMWVTTVLSCYGTDVGDHCSLMLRTQMVLWVNLQGEIKYTNGTVHVGHHYSLINMYM
jgi:hypothetical protein